METKEETRERLLEAFGLIMKWYEEKGKVNLNKVKRANQSEYSKILRASAPLEKAGFIKTYCWGENNGSKYDKRQTGFTIFPTNLGITRYKKAKGSE